MIVESDKRAYALFSASGEEISYGDLWSKLHTCEVLCFGELHNNAMAHWMQMEMLLDWHRIWDKHKLCFCLEIFERHHQEFLDSYAKDDISLRTLREQTGLKSHFERDYGPLLEFARSKGIKLVASNIPRYLARRVYQDGLDSFSNLSEVEKSYVAPLPIQIDESLPSYANMIKMLPEHSSTFKLSNFIAAQAIKDATMADTILNYLNQGNKIMHINGAYHTDFQEGIIWYIHQHTHVWNIGTVSVVEQSLLGQLEAEHHNKADIVMAVNSRIPKTYIIDQI